MNKKTNEELFIQFQQETDTYKKEQIANELFSKNEKFIHYISKKFKNSKLPYDEVVNLATIGMVKSLKTYNPDASKFLTYSSRLMTNEILMELRKVEYKKDTISTETLITENLTLGAMLEDKDIVFEKTLEYKDVIRCVLDYSYKFLSKREQYILMNEFNESPKKQRELALELNLSQAQISRLQKKIIVNVKNYLINLEAV